MLEQLSDIIIKELNTKELQPLPDNFHHELTEYIKKLEQRTKTPMDPKSIEYHIYLRMIAMLREGVGLLMILRYNKRPVEYDNAVSNNISKF